MRLSIPTRLALFYLLYYAIVGTFLPYWNLYLAQQGFATFEIGLLSSIAILTRFYAPFIWGWLADYSGKRMLWVRIATCVETVIWCSVFFIVPKFATIAVIMLIFSFFQNAILAQFEAVTLFWLGEQREQRYGAIRRWGSVGFIMGVFGVGWLLQSMEIDDLPFILLAIAAVTFFWSFTIAEPTLALSASKPIQSIVPILKRPAVWGFFVIEFIMLFAHATFYSFYSNYLQLYHYSSVHIGSLWAIGVIAEILMFGAANYFFARWSWRQLVTMCVVVNTLRWLIVGLFPQYFALQILAQTAHAFSFGLFHLVAMRLIFYYFSPAQQGRAQAMYSTMWGLGVAAGSLLAGQFWTSIGANHIFMWAGVSSLLGLLFIGLIQTPEPMSLPQNTQN